MAAHVVKINSLVIVRSKAAPDELPADIYSRIAEHFGNDDDILELSVEVLPLPVDLNGCSH